MVQVKIKWNKKEYEIDVNPAEGVPQFKAQLTVATGVPAERQKLMGKGLWTGILKDDADMTSMKFTPGQIITLMGTADVVKEPVAKVVFVEDMTDAQKAEKGAVIPAGLTNLGNSCYMNSVLECVRYMPDLREKLSRVPPVPRDTQHEADVLLANDLSNTLQQLDRAVGSHIPLFVPSIRERNQLFAQRGNGGGYMQQDAEEFFNYLMQVFRAGLGKVGSSLDDFMEIEMENRLSCLESTDEPVVVSSEKVCKVVCNIMGTASGGGASASINHLHEGLALSLEGSVEKNSDLLGRNAQWAKRQKIKKLPKYLCVQFMRFFWKATPDSRDHSGVKCKIVRAVNFSEKLDVYDLCADDVQGVLRENRAADEKIQDEKFAKKRAVESEATTSDSSSAMEIEPVPAAASTGGGGKSIDMDDEEAAMAAALAMSLGGDNNSVFTGTEAAATKKTNTCFNSGIPDNFSGMYELFGVVTHKGRDADSGHYIGWVRQDEGSDLWWKYDDDIVTEVDTAEILALKGGGDWHTAYLNFYRAIIVKKD